jgi:glycerol-3-phosphate dehydrogenase
MMQRSDMVRQLRTRTEPWDIVIIGGGATGLGAAVDAASRGYDVCLLERSDFAKGTSSRSTKLVHGGVRYLQQGNITLVMEALRERGRLLKNAPHIVRDLAFIVPSYQWWESPWYGIGLKVYDTLAGRYGFGKSSYLSREKLIEAIPSISQNGLRGGTRYYDGQFDDARLAINLAETAADQGATVINYFGVTGLVKDEDGMVAGVKAQDRETDQQVEISAKVVINATGPYTDEVRRMDHAEARPIIQPSQGTHIVLDRSFLPCDSAIMVPHTSDGRVMFAIPWHNVCVVGTTDVPIKSIDDEPVPTDEEIDFILETANRYLAKTATRADICSVFAGIRPLVKEGGDDDTSSVSRDHSILIDQASGLITIAGGKWTTYRRMGEEVIDNAATLADLEPRRCVTRELPIHGYHNHPKRFGELRHYGSDANQIRGLAHDTPELGQPIHDRLPTLGAEVVWAARHEMARTLEDVLSRRTRCLLFDAEASMEAAPHVAGLMAKELGRDDQWVEQEVTAFHELARQYLPSR